MPLLRSLALCAGLLVIAACGPDGPKPPKGADGPAATQSAAEGDAPAAAESAPELPAEDLGEFRIVSVLLGKDVGPDNVVLADSEVFASKDSIRASVLTTGAHQGLSLSARWLAPDGSTIAETVQPLVPTAATAATFEISNPQGWPTGHYQVLIGVNKRTLQTKQFEVR